MKLSFVVDYIEEIDPDKRKKALWIICAVVVGIILLGNEGVWNMFSHARKIAKLRVELAQLKDEETVLQKELKLIGHDMAYVERLARKELGLIQPGEIEFRFVPEPKTRD